MAHYVVMYPSLGFCYGLIVIASKIAGQFVHCEEDWEWVTKIEIYGKKLWILWMMGKLWIRLKDWEREIERDIYNTKLWRVVWMKLRTNWGDENCVIYNRIENTFVHVDTYIFGYKDSLLLRCEHSYKLRYEDSYTYIKIWGLVIY